MFLKKKDDLNIDQFWKDYEAKIGEKVLAKSLGRYIGGVAGQSEPLWGLAIATSGGFRFHHFPHEGWLMALSRITTGGEAPKEKTFFIPRSGITSVDLVVEKRWWKKLLAPAMPLLVIRCTLDGVETEVTVETDRQAREITEALGN